MNATQLGHYSNYNAVWVEITNGSHEHGGEGWGFGTCLWSPAKNRAGNDRYSIMRRPKPRDLVLHFYGKSASDPGADTSLVGRSAVQSSVQEVDDEPPSPGRWGGMAPYYRIDLNKYEAFDAPLRLPTVLRLYGDEIRAELDEAKTSFYPFAPYRDMVRPTQGIYLAECTANLFRILREALEIEEGSKTTGAGEELHREYEEGRRALLEIKTFVRNPAVARAAKATHGKACQACGFDFEKTYGEIGRGFIECVRLDPLASRPGALTGAPSRTAVDRVAVLCANCRRMRQRRTPPFSVEELRELLDTART